MRRPRLPVRRREGPELPAGFQEVSWHSQVLRKQMAFIVHLPSRYLADSDEPYPVLYLLHGSGHDGQSVLREVRPQDQVAMLGQAILVVPDGDQGWWLDSPRLPRSQYRQYVLELVDLVDCRYHSSNERTGRGICGFSMGGYGSMLLAAQHPEVFGAASSLLGPLDIGQMFPDYHRLRLLLGADRETWRRFSPISQVRNLAHTALRFCSAREAPDRQQNEAFAVALQELHIPFQYGVHPGGHDTAFVREHIGECFAFHRRSFDHGY